MNSEQPEAAQRAALNADITATRAELGQTLEAIAAKTQVKNRAEQAARDTFAGVENRVAVGASRALNEVGAGWRRIRGLPARTRLSVVAVLGGALSAASAIVAVVRPKNQK
jgi:hypothetical protein